MKIALRLTVPVLLSILAFGASASSAFAATVANQVDHYTATANNGADFIRSSEAFSTSTDSGGTVSQTKNQDGSVTVNASSTSAYADSGFFTSPMRLGDVKSVSVTGSNSFGVNIWLDKNSDNYLDANGKFFTWNGDVFTSTGGDGFFSEGSSVPDSNGTLTINDSSSFHSYATDVAPYSPSITLGELKAQYPDKDITFWVGVTVMSGGSKATTITAFNVVPSPVVNTTTGNGYSTIQDAINHANSGDTINVAAGDYNESLNITTPVILQSTGGRDVTTIRSLTIATSSVTVSGFTIKGISASGVESANVFVNSGVSNVTISNNKIIDVGSGSREDGDSGVGFLTSISDLAHIGDNVKVTGNIFQALVTGSNRAFYINPGINRFTFSGNTITGNFTHSSVTQAQDGLIQNNTVTGVGSSGSRSAGFSTWGYPDATVWGHTTFSGNTITGTGNAIAVNATNNVTINGNTLSGNGTGVWIGDSTPTSFDVTTISAHNNDVSHEDTYGVTNASATTTNVDASSNWWGTASSTEIVANKVSSHVNYTPWYTNAAMTMLSDNTSTNATYTSTTVGQINMPSGATDVVLTDSKVMDLSAGVVDDTVTLNSGTPNTAVVLSNSNSNVAGITASIPDGTVITGESSWDGKITPPTATPILGTAPSGFSIGSTVISIGDPLVTLLFNKPVTIFLPGITGTVGYKSAHSSSWNTIAACAGTNYDSPTPPTSPGECSIVNPNGSGTKVLTYHFTTFGSLVLTPVISPNGSVFHGSQDVTIDVVSGTTVHYTTGASMPDCSSATYSGTLTFSNSTTLNAIRCDGTNESAVATATFSPAAGNGGNGGGNNGGGSIAAAPAAPATPATPTVSPATPATQATPAQGRGQVLGAATYNFTKALAVGSRGADVTALQQFLLDNKFFSETPTGYFGQLTKKAVIAFQTARGISQTGNVGPLTRAELNKGTIAVTPETHSGSKLTADQVSSILGLLQSFGADQSVIDNTRLALAK